MSEQVAIEIVEAPAVSVDVVEEAGVKVVELMHPGPQGPPGGGGSGAASRAVRIDSTSTANTIYVGRAPAGSGETSAVWSIIRTTFTPAGASLGSSSRSAVTWAGRTSHSYP